MAQKTFQVQDSCRCSRKCPQRIDSERQKAIFDCFYKLENWTQKVLFLRTLFKTAPVKEKLNPIINLKKRTKHNQYYLSHKDGTQQQVCLTFLLNCIQITRFRMLSAVDSAASNESAKDTRGKFPTRKTKENDISFVKDFIKSFLTYESHYSNKSGHSNRKYLSPFLTIRRMYREYCLKCDFERKKPVHESKFREIFNNDFNLSFARLKVDTRHLSPM